MTDKMKIVYKKTEDLIPYARNSRTHSEMQINQIASSIREFGFRVPVIVDGENGIIAGHGRTLAALKLGIDEIPTIDGSDMTDVQKRMYVIADNKLALNANWDDELLMLEIKDLQDLGADISLLAFDPSELTNMIDPVEENESSGEDYNPSFTIVIDCSSQQEQDKIFNELDSKGYKCRIQNQ